MILFALFANLFIAVVKFIVAFITASSAMLAEAIHSLADSMNQILLLVGIRRGRRQPDSLHPFGFSGELYFWSFIVAIILFTMGSIFSIYEGIHKIRHPEPIKSVSLAILVLVVSIIAEGIAFFRASRRVIREKGELSVMTYLRRTKKSELIVVFLEDLAAICGLTVALVLITIQHFTGILILDGVASVVIGVILGFVALFLGNETKSLLIGEAADPRVIRQVTKMLDEDESVNRLIFIKSLQLGPEDILLAVKLEFDHRLTSVEISNIINSFEKEIRYHFPDIKKIFIVGFF